jgi:hypothetical protein
MKSAHALPPQNVVRQAGLAFFQNFPDTTDWDKPRFQCHFQAKIHRIIGLAKILPPLGMADNHVRRPHRQQLCSGCLSGERAFVLPVDILSSYRNARSLGRLNRRRQIQERRAHHDFVAGVP